MINFKIFTLFEEMFPGPLSYSIMGNGYKNKIWDLQTINIRNYAFDAHKTVDDTSYGGGAGMILKADVLANAIENNISSKTRLIYLSPRGKLFNQKMAQNLAQEEEIALICGRYEGIDQRVLDKFQIEEVSIGDYVLSCGEIASFVMIDAILRNVKGILGDEESLCEESFSMAESEFLLEYPQYTRPKIWQDLEVPEILVCGHHQKINEWRKKKSIEITKLNRYDLYEKYINSINKKND